MAMFRPHLHRIPAFNAAPRQTPLGPLEIDRGHPLANGLVANWLLGGHRPLDDLCGRNIPLIKIGTPRAASAPWGSGYSLVFANSDSLLGSPTAPDMPTGTAARTVSVWYQTSSSSSPNVI